MSEPMQPTPPKEGGLKQPPQTSPSQPQDDGAIDRENAPTDDNREGGMIGEGDSEH